MADRDPKTGQFKVGHIGIGGRPKGSRNKLTEQFFTDLYDRWKERGIAAIDQMIDEKPGDFVKVVATQMPKQLEMNANPLGDLTEDELTELLAVARQLVRSSTVDGSGDGTEAQTKH